MPQGCDIVHEAGCVSLVRCTGQATVGMLGLQDLLGRRSMCSGTSMYVGFYEKLCACVCVGAGYVYVEG